MNVITAPANSLPYEPMPALFAAKFTVLGFDVPVVRALDNAYVARVEKDNGAFAEMLSTRSPEDAINRLVTELERNRRPN